MNLDKKTTAAFLWSFGSLLFLGAILTFVFIYQPPAGSDAEKTKQLLDRWGLVSNIWRVETIGAVLLAISSGYFAISKQSLSWITVSLAHIIMITMYGYLLGAYPTAAEFHGEVPSLFPMVNDTAIWIFGLSNLLFLIGLSGIYYNAENLNTWFRKSALVISLVGAISTLALFFNLITFAQMNMAGPVILILYLFNAYLGIRLAKETENSTVP